MESDNEVNFSVNDPTGEVLNFSGIVNPDSLITIPEFSNGQETFSGSATRDPDLRITLGNNCFIFTTEATTLIFEEN